MKALVSKFYLQPVFALEAIQFAAVGVGAAVQTPLALAVCGAVVGFCTATKQALVKPVKA